LLTGAGAPIARIRSAISSRASACSVYRVSKRVRSALNMGPVTF
jgi:hypothetical protein